MTFLSQNYNFGLMFFHNGIPGTVQGSYFIIAILCTIVAISKIPLYNGICGTVKGSQFLIVMSQFCDTNVAT